MWCWILSHYIYLMILRNGRGSFMGPSSSRLLLLTSRQLKVLWMCLVSMTNQLLPWLVLWAWLLPQYASVRGQPSGSPISGWSPVNSRIISGINSKVISIVVSLIISDWFPIQCPIQSPVNSAIIAMIAPMIASMIVSLIISIWSPVNSVTNSVTNSILLGKS